MAKVVAKVVVVVKVVVMGMVVKVVVKVVATVVESKELSTRWLAHHQGRYWVLHLQKNCRNQCSLPWLLNNRSL